MAFYIKKNKLSRKTVSARHKKNKTKIKSKTKTRTKNLKLVQNGNGNNPVISSIIYGTTTIQPNQLFQNNSQLLATPKIILNLQLLKTQSNSSTSNQQIVVIMTDPDAPNGLESPTDNITYTHWIFVYSTNETILKYAPPTPPKGTHRYQFNVYSMTQQNIDQIKRIMLDSKYNRGTYYNAMENIIKVSSKMNQEPFEYRVTASAK